MKNVKIIKNNYKCNNCNKSYKTINNLDNHIKTECKLDVKYNNIFVFKTETFGKNKYPKDNGGDIYIIQTEFDLKNYYKIGITTNLYNRMTQYRCGAVLEPRLHCYFPIKNIKEADKTLKQKLSKYNIKREIYKCENLNEIKNIIKSIQQEFKSDQLNIIPDIKECDVCQCKYCDIVFTNKYELSIHYTNCEKNITHIKNINYDSNNVCKYCNKTYKHLQSKWRHEQICDNKIDVIKLKDKQDIMESEIQELKKEIIELKNKKINYLKINKTGNENMNILSYNEVSTIFDNEISSVIKLVELVNFNNNKPENHSFCSTALASPYLSYYNTDTNTIDKERKKFFFEDVICKSIQNHEILFNKYKNKFDLAKKKKIEENIYNLKQIRDNSFNNKTMQEMIRKLNLLSYNKRDLIQSTWSKDSNEENDSDEEFMRILLNPPEDSEKESTNSESSDSEERPQLLLGSKNKNINL